MVPPVVGYFLSRSITRFDERKSESDFNGLNRESFVLISGSARNMRAGSGLTYIDHGPAFNMFTPAQVDAIDCVRADYQDTLPAFQDADEIVQ
ncbi:MAG: hypothetical protein ABIF71_10655 [Planctomycetota bacterium]